MGPITFVVLILLAILLTVAVLKGWISDRVFQTIIGVATVVGLLAAILVFVVPQPSEVHDSMPTQTVQSTTSQPTPSATSSTKGNLIYRCTFDTNDTNCGWSSSQGIRIENGNLILAPGRDAFLDASGIATDFQLNARFFIQDSGSIAFYLRNQLPTCEDGSWTCSIKIVLDFSNRNSQTFVARRSLGDKAPIEISSKIITALRLNDWNEIVASANEDKYAIKVNDVLVLEFVDNGYASGSFIIDNDPGSSSEIEFDYFEIYQIQ